MSINDDYYDLNDFVKSNEAAEESLQKLIGYINTLESENIILIGRDKNMVATIKTLKEIIDEENKELKGILQTLVSKYIANLGTDSQFVTCITPKGTPDYWIDAIEALNK